MPGLDKTGPRGQGSRTGRSLGYCPPGYSRGFRRFGRGLGLGQGRGFGFGRGWGWPFGGYPYDWPFYDKLTVKEEKEILTEELKGLKEEIKGIEARLEELKSKKTK